VSNQKNYVVHKSRDSVLIKLILEIALNITLHMQVSNLNSMLESFDNVWECLACFTGLASSLVLKTGE
jgi:hypothetical protein